MKERRRIICQESLKLLSPCKNVHTLLFETRFELLFPFVFLLPSRCQIPMPTISPCTFRRALCMLLLSPLYHLRHQRMERSIRRKFSPLESLTHQPSSTLLPHTAYVWLSSGLPKNPLCFGADFVFRSLREKRIPGRAFHTFTKRGERHAKREEGGKMEQNCLMSEHELNRQKRAAETKGNPASHHLHDFLFLPFPRFFVLQFTIKMLSLETASPVVVLTRDFVSSLSSISLSENQKQGSRGSVQRKNEITLTHSQRFSSLDHIV